MNDFMKILLSLSVSGTLLLLLILGLKPLYKNRFSKRWQYYIWIIVALRFLLPFTPDTTIVGSLFEKPDTTAVTNEIPTNTNVPASTDTDNSNTEPIQASRDITVTMREPFNRYVCLFFMWSIFALVLFVRKITIYQGFIQYIKAGSTEVSDIKTLNLLSDCEEKLNIKTRVELSRNPLIASPIMIGFFRARIVLPACELDDKEWSYIFVHELIHYKQRDMFYKWLIQIVVCAHWFNPFVYLLEKEVNKSCELSCDEKVISILDDKARREYGDTLISFLQSNNLYKSSLASVTLTEGAEQLKERLGAIMKFKKKSKGIIAITAIFSVLVCVCFFMTGAYAASPVTNDNLVLKDNDKLNEVSIKAESDRSIIESETVEAAVIMNTATVKGVTWYLVESEAHLRAIGTGEYGLDKNYMQNADITMSKTEWVPIGTESNPFTGQYNGNGYEIKGLTMTSPTVKIIGFFGFAENAQLYNITLRDLDIETAGGQGKSVGAICARATDCNIHSNKVYSIYDYKLNEVSIKAESDRNIKETENKTEKTEKQYSTEYAQHGITVTDDIYYYQGERVRIFMDLRMNGSFENFIFDNEGSIDLRVSRDKNNSITNIEYLTESEADELLYDMDEYSPNNQLEIPLEKEDSFDSFDNNSDVPLKEQNMGRSVRITKEELSQELRDIINSCDTETWYVIENAGYQYIYFGGLPYNYSFQPEIYTDRNSGTINIFDMGTTTGNYVLLEIQQNVSLTINYNGTQISYTEL